MTSTDTDNPNDFVNAEYDKVAFLPIELALKDGRRAIVRNMQSSECGILYKLFMGAAGQGEGYSVDEYPSLRAFVEEVVESYYSVIIEDKSSGDIMAGFQFAPTVFSRMREPPVCDSHIVINPRFAGKGVGTELCRMMMSTCREMGFNAMINDTLLAMLK